VKRVHEPGKIARLRRDAHKGHRGRVLIVAGSLRMSGAARLAGWGALRGGAGLVTIATPDVVQPVVAAELPCAMTLPLPSRRGAFAAAGAAAAREFAEGVDVVAIGPGITRGVASFLRRFLDGLAKPVVVDADALNILSDEAAMLDAAEGPKVLTPHPGEAGRLLGREVDGNQEERLGAAAELADAFHATVLLKGAGTVVCDGERWYVNKTGNPGLATGGTGDVLTGLVAARIASGTHPFVAVTQAAHVHGRAADIAKGAVGENSMIATDVVANLAAAILELTETAPKKTKGAKGSGSRRRSGRAR
jgi:NAD(P)H-hydrate epimerase